VIVCARAGHKPAGKQEDAMAKGKDKGSKEKKKPKSEKPKGSGSAYQQSKK
jgi:hypothetical protein